MSKFSWIYKLAVLLIFGAVLAKGSDVIPKTKIEGQLLNFLIRWRSGYKFSISLPPLDIITLNGLQGTYESKRIQFTYNTTEIHLRGVNNFSVTQLNVYENKLQASGKLEFPAISVSSDDYNLHGRAYYVYTLNGSGRLKVKFRNVQLLFDLGFANIERSTYSTIDLDFAVESIEGDLENSSWLINKVLNNDGLGILNGYHDTIINTTKTFLTGYVDDLLRRVSLTQLLSKIST